MMARSLRTAWRSYSVGRWLQLERRWRPELPYRGQASASQALPKCSTAFRMPKVIEIKVPDVGMEAQLCEALEAQAT